MKRLVALLACVATPVVAQAPLPFDVGGAFSLVDQRGEVRSEDSFDGPALLFFGYAQCQSICTVALPRMAETVDLLAEQGISVQPVLVTVDPARDTPASLQKTAPIIHPRLVALTGSDEALAQARSAFRVESEVIGEDIEGPLYAHGSFVYLLDAQGEMLTILPPVLGSERMAEIAVTYLKD
jgi:protein SCO1/2